MSVRETLTEMVRQWTAQNGGAPETPEAVVEAFAAELAAERAADDGADPNDCRRRIYVDGKGDGWIDLTVDPESGERELTGITNPWKIASAEDVRNDTGDLREIGRCW